MAEGEKKIPTKFYDVHNPTPGPRVIHDAAHQSVTIMPGMTVPGVELNDKIADEYRARVKDNPNADVQLKAASGRKKAFVHDDTDRSEAGAGGDEGDEGDDSASGNDDGVSDAKRQANALIDQADETEFNAWKDQVKDALGDKWPGGKPRKKDLVKLLKKVK